MMLSLKSDCIMTLIWAGKSHAEMQVVDSKG